MQPYSWNINGEKYPDAKPIELANGELVRFIIENPTGMDHPFHLHGHYFYVLGDPENPNLTDPPQKDTVNIPAKSSLAIQSGRQQPRTLVLPLPHRVARGDRHGPRDPDCGVATFPGERRHERNPAAARDHLPARRAPASGGPGLVPNGGGRRHELDPLGELLGGKSKSAAAQCRRAIPTN